MDRSVKLLLTLLALLGGLSVAPAHGRLAVDSGPLVEHVAAPRSAAALAAVSAYHKRARRVEAIGRPEPDRLLARSGMVSIPAVRQSDRARE